MFKANFFFYRYADLLSIDDEVLVKENDDLIPVKIINVSNSIMQGISHS